MIFFLDTEQLMIIHDAQLKEHGGLPGCRDYGAISAILSRVENLNIYEDENDIYVLASAYLVAVSRGHGFNDANKITALLAELVFLDMNDITLTTPVSFADYVAEIAQGMHETRSVAEALRMLA